ncbi:MAG: 3D domain-containing protein [Candidatus Yanofskybacteria bacterium]|nr:3D domain-containing protein [Candidatus Yanofskybacteria bacterium]
MNKNITKIKQTMVLVTLLTLVFSVGFPVANAALFNWTSEDSKDSTIQIFNFVTSYLNVNSELPNSQKEPENLPLVQNNSLVSIGSPVIQKVIKSVQTKNTNQLIREMVVHATAYSSTPDQTDDTPFITAWNTTVRDGIIAANFLPFGTKIKIPDIYGDKIFTVEDRMNRRYWYRIDIWFPDRTSALDFGLKQVKIHVLES